MDENWDKVWINFLIDEGFEVIPKKEEKDEVKE